MSEARTYKVKSPLSRQINEPGGRTVQDAAYRAGQGLEGHRKSAMAAIAAALDELDAVAATAAPDAGPRVYKLASEVIDLGGYFDLGPLHEATYSLCDLADRMIAAQAWHWPPVKVHLQAMRLILTGRQMGRSSDALVTGLRSISQRSVG